MNSSSCNRPAEGDLLFISLIGQTPGEKVLRTTASYSVIYYTHTHTHTHMAWVMSHVMSNKEAADWKQHIMVSVSVQETRGEIKRKALSKIFYITFDIHVKINMSTNEDSILGSDPGVHWEFLPSTHWERNLKPKFQFLSVAPTWFSETVLSTKVGNSELACCYVFFFILLLFLCEGALTLSTKTKQEWTFKGAGL